MVLRKLILCEPHYKAIRNLYYKIALTVFVYLLLAPERGFKLLNSIF